MIEEIHNTARTSRYHRSVRHLERCRRLAMGICDWRPIPPDYAKVRGVVRACGQRLGFPKQPDFDGLLLAA